VLTLTPTPAPTPVPAESSPTGARGHVSTAATTAAAADSMPMRAAGRLPTLPAVRATTAAATAGGERGARHAAESHGYSSPRHRMTFNYITQVYYVVMTWRVFSV
jgi:hypothetical protein